MTLWKYNKRVCFLLNPFITCYKILITISKLLEDLYVYTTYLKLDLAFSIEAVEDVLNLHMLPGVQAHKVQSPPSSGIGVSLSQLFMSKSNAISPVPIVLIKQGKTPVTIIDLSALPIAAEIDLSLEGNSTLWLTEHF